MYSICIYYSLWLGNAGCRNDKDRPKNREKAKQSVGRAAAKLTSSKFSILLYPEGTRSGTGELKSFKKGGFILAIRLKLPLVPISIIGASSILPTKSFTLQKGDIKIIIDASLNTADLDEKDANKLMTQCRNAIIQNKEAYI